MQIDICSTMQIVMNMIKLRSEILPAVTTTWLNSAHTLHKLTYCFRFNKTCDRGAVWNSRCCTT